MAKQRKRTAKGPQFTKSRVASLYRHQGGNYYAAVKVAGKLRRRSLDTDDFASAKARLPGVLEELRGVVAAEGSPGSVREALLEEAGRENATIKDTSRHYYRQVASSLLKTADGMSLRPADLPLAKIGGRQLRAWFDQHAQRVSRTRYNGAVALVRRMFTHEIEARRLVRNPASDLRRLAPRPSKPTIPTSEDFARVVEDIASQGKRHSKATAAAVRLLASTGLRISEAQALLWRDIDGKALVIRTAKNDQFRRVPLTDAAKAVLAELQAVLPCRGENAVLPIKSPRIALANACERLGLPHLRVHDLRHIFATRCIEAGVDLPTVASWLGHKDGGVLAAQIYGHVLERHSEKQIARVKI